MKINKKNYRTVWMDKNIIKIIDQRKLPHLFHIINIKNYKKAAKAIKTMAIRGAPAIGGITAYAIAQAAINDKETIFFKFKENIRKVKEALIATRPTAYELFFAAEKVENAVLRSENIKEAKKNAKYAADEYVKRSLWAGKRIGIFGQKLIKNNYNILTHCNAGSLATIDFGTALAPIVFSKYDGKNIHVFVDETRPRLQGARLTAFELEHEKVPFSIIADNAAGYYMQKKVINMCIVGADRIAMNGDIANKIGTYEKAVIAKENNIPFYVAAPLATFDRSLKTGKDIEIEERNADEVLKLMGIRISTRKAHALNPAFDVTPAKYITGIITEYGIIKANKKDIAKAFAKAAKDKNDRIIQGN